MSKGMDRLRQSLGDHIKESMGGTSAGGAGGPLPPVAHGVPGRYDGLVRPKDVYTFPVEHLRPDPEQPRKEFDEEELGRLAESLRTRGQLQPIRVRYDAQLEGWVIVSGERRWRAAKLAGLQTLAAVEVKNRLGTEELLEDQLVENCLREDLKPIEQAHAFRALLERRGCSQRQLADSLAISHMAVGRALQLLDLPPEVQDAVEQGNLPPATAYELGKLDDPAEQVEMAEAAVAQKLTRSEVADAVRAVKARRPSLAPRPEPINVEVEPGVIVAVRWRKSSPVTAIHALKKAIRLLQDRDRDDRVA